MARRVPRQADLFGRAPRPRVRRMHVIDAGNAPDGGRIAAFECRRCGATSGWVYIGTVSEAKRGIPCERCSGGGMSP
jgi:DNA-directed RNA polymerase subunit RPC12/RpoP